MEEEEFLVLREEESQYRSSRGEGKKGRTFPIRRWSRFAASSRNFLYSVICFVSGKEIP